MSTILLYYHRPVPMQRSRLVQTRPLCPHWCHCIRIPHSWRHCLNSLILLKWMHSLLNTSESRTAATFHSWCPVGPAPQITHHRLQSHRQHQNCQKHRNPRCHLPFRHHWQLRPAITPTNRFQLFHRARWTQAQLVHRQQMPTNRVHRLWSVWAVVS